MNHIYNENVLFLQYCYLCCLDLANQEPYLCRIHRKDEINAERWLSFFDSDGRIEDPVFVRSEIFHAVCYKIIHVSFSRPFSVILFDVGYVWFV